MEQARANLPKIQFERFYGYIPLRDLKEYLKNKYMYSLAGIPQGKDIEFVPHRNRVFAYMVTKGAWYKLRILTYDWLSCTKEPVSGIFYLTLSPINQNSVKLVSEIDRYLYLSSVDTDISNSKKGVAKDTSDQLAVGVCEASQVARYTDIRPRMCKGLDVVRVLVNQVFNFLNQEYYELQFLSDLFGTPHIVRLVSKDGSYRLDCTSAIKNQFPSLEPGAIRQSARQVFEQREDLLLAHRSHSAIKEVTARLGMVEKSLKYETCEKKLKLVYEVEFEASKRLVCYIGIRKGVMEIQAVNMLEEKKHAQIQQIRLQDANALNTFGEFLESLLGAERIRRISQQSQRVESLRSQSSKEEAMREQDLNQFSAEPDSQHPMGRAMSLTSSLRTNSDNKIGLSSQQALSQEESATDKDKDSQQENSEPEVSIDQESNMKTKKSETGAIQSAQLLGSFPPSPFQEISETPVTLDASDDHPLNISNPEVQDLLTSEAPAKHEAPMHKQETAAVATSDKVNIIQSVNESEYMHPHEYKKVTQVFDEE